MSAALPRPLDGHTVVDLTIALAGPYATQLLGALGATVIKVENPAGGDPARNNAPYFSSAGLTRSREGEDAMSVSMLERGREKLGITLNLKHPEGRAVLGDLVQRADVLVENFSAGTTDRMGIGYGWASDLNERLVYTSISGFGVGDPGKGMDTIFQALSGLMLMSGAEDGPPVRSGVPFGDLTGPLFAVIGTLAALVLRERTGRGQHVDVSLLGSLTALAATEPWGTMERAGIEMRTGNTVPRLTPFGIFATTDGHVALCAPTDGFAHGVFVALGRPELEHDERFVTRDRRVENHRALHGEIATWAAARTAAEAVAALEAAGVPTAVVRGPDDAVRDERVVRRRETVPLEHPTLGAVDDLVGSGLPIRYSAARTGYERAAPWLGEHNDFVLGGVLGYDEERIRELRALGAV